MPRAAIVVATVFIAAWAASSRAAGQPGPQARPNFVVIQADDLGHVGHDAG